MGIHQRTDSFSKPPQMIIRTRAPPVVPFDPLLSFFSLSFATITSHDIKTSVLG